MADTKKRTINLPFICAIFFFSGFPALIYQLVWQRALFEIYGINVESVTVVVTAFMLGLGLGSIAGGWISKFSRVPLLLAFGIIEVGIAGFGVASLWLFETVGTATLQASPQATAIYTFLLVLFPTLLMGATLPILVTHLVKHSSNVGKSVGILYFANTLGSAAACFAVALFLMRILGASNAIHAAVVLNSLVAVAAFVAWKKSPRTPGTGKAMAESAVGATRLGKRFYLALALVSLTGFISLSYEILWFRVHSFTTASSAWAFSLLLGSFLTGIALGSLFARRFCHDSSEQPSLGPLAGFVLVANLMGFLVVPISAFLMTWLPYPALLPLVIISAGALGATFPLIAHYGVPPDSKAGARISYIYLANIIGSAGGSLLTGFVLMDHFSIQQINLGLTVLGCALAAVLFAMSSKRRIQGAVVATLVSVLAVVLTPTLFDRLYERLQLKSEFDGEYEFAHVVENKSGVITVGKDGTVFGGGVYDGKFSTSLVHDSNMIIRAYGPSLFQKVPKRVLMIGLSTGSWTQVVANHPDLEEMIAIEINPGYVELIEQYDVVKSLLDNPKLELVVDDGRRWLNRHPDEKFDLIMINTTYNWRAHASALLSVEFLELMRKHLNEGGIAMYNSTGSARVQKTASEVFPYAYRMINFMVVSDSPMPLDKDRWASVLMRYKIDGQRVFDFSNKKHAKRFEEVLSIIDTATENPHAHWAIEPRESLLKRHADVEVITDDNMGAEWSLTRK